MAQEESIIAFSSITILSKRLEQISASSPSGDSLGRVLKEFIIRGQQESQGTSFCARSTGRRAREMIKNMVKKKWMI